MANGHPERQIINPGTAKEIFDCTTLSGWERWFTPAAKEILSEIETRRNQSPI